MKLDLNERGNCTIYMISIFMKYLYFGRITSLTTTTRTRPTISRFNVEKNDFYEISFRIGYYYYFCEQIFDLKLCVYNVRFLAN